MQDVEFEKWCAVTRLTVTRHSHSLISSTGKSTLPLDNQFVHHYLKSPKSPPLGAPKMHPPPATHENPEHPAPRTKEQQQQLLLLPS